MPSPVTELAELPGKALRPGDFYARGTAKLLAPSLSVDGVGQIAVPLLPGQAEQLVAVSERAPYGRGPDTIIDTAVRNTWQIGSDRVHIIYKASTGRQPWPRCWKRSPRGLGAGDPIEAEFYKLLVHDQGSFFVGHRDTEKSPGMFATRSIPRTGAGRAAFRRSQRQRRGFVRASLWTRDFGRLANDRALAVLTQMGLGVTVPHLLDLAQRWTASGADRASPSWREAHKLAERVGDGWPDYSEATATEDSSTTGLLIALTTLGDTDGIGGSLRRVVGAGRGYAKSDNAAAIAIL
nr:hypothetical protein [uncultured Rhodopila sp.]